MIKHAWYFPRGLATNSSRGEVVCLSPKNLLVSSEVQRSSKLVGESQFKTIPHHLFPPFSLLCWSCQLAWTNVKRHENGSAEMFKTWWDWAYSDIMPTLTLSQAGRPVEPIHACHTGLKDKEIKMYVLHTFVNLPMVSIPLKLIVLLLFMLRAFYFRNSS